jgi:hypothetical protein
MGCLRQHAVKSAAWALSVRVAVGQAQGQLPERSKLGFVLIDFRGTMASKLSNPPIN